MKVFEQRKIQRRIENSVLNWGKDRQRPSFSWLKSGGSSQHFLSSTWKGALVPAELKDMYQIVMYIPWGGTGSLFHSLSCCFLTDSPLLLHSFVPLRGTLRSLIMENCSRVCTVARFRSQNGLGPKCHLLCQENYAWFSFSRDPPPYLLNKSTCTGTWRAGNLRRLNSSFVGSNAYSRWWVSEWDWIVGPPVGISDSLLEPGKNFGGTGL